MVIILAKMLLFSLFANYALAENSTLQDLLKAADVSYDMRADGFLESGHLDPKIISASIDNYEEAIILDPNNLELHFKLIEALYFLGYYVVTDQDQKEDIFSRCLSRSESALRIIAEKSSEPEELFNKPPKDQARLTKSIQGADAAYFWASISIGLWGMTHGNFASARKDVAGKIRKYASTLIELNPQYSNGGGYRLLGRLYTVAPKIPFFTGWINREEGLQLLYQAKAISTSDPRNLLFLAEAILEYRPESEEEAVALLKQVARWSPNPEYLVEELETISMAKERLLKLEKI